MNLPQLPLGVAVMDRVRRERDRFVGFVIEGVEDEIGARLGFGDRKRLSASGPII